MSNENRKYKIKIGFHIILITEGRQTNYFMDTPIKHKVYVTRKIPEPGPSILKSHFQLRMNPKVDVLKRENLVQNVRGVYALMCMLGDKIDSSIMDAAGPNLKVIS